MGRYIGTKGLGFLSILEIAENLEVHSGPFDFQFNKQKTATALSRGEKPTPSFQVPWSANADNIVSDMRKDGYATVIKLKLKPDEKLAVAEELESFNHHFLLFSQNIDSISIQTDDLSKTVNLDKKQLSKDGIKSKSRLKLIFKENGKKIKSEEWIKWQRDWESAEDNTKNSSCIFCLQIKNGQCFPEKETTTVYNFYPTDEDSEIRGRLHVSFQLSRNRQNLQMWENEEDSRLIEETTALIIDDVINDNMVPAGTIIDCFSDLNKYKDADTDNKPLRHIQKSLINCIKETPFLPTFGDGFTSINDVIVWDHEVLDCLYGNAPRI